MPAIEAVGNKSYKFSSGKSQSTTTTRQLQLQLPAVQQMIRQQASKTAQVKNGPPAQALTPAREPQSKKSSKLFSAALSGHQLRQNNAQSATSFSSHGRPSPRAGQRSNTSDPTKTQPQHERTLQVQSLVKREKKSPPGKPGSSLTKINEYFVPRAATSKQNSSRERSQSSKDQGASQQLRSKKSASPINSKITKPVKKTPTAPLRTTQNNVNAMPQLIEIHSSPEQSRSEAEMSAQSSDSALENGSACDEDADFAGDARGVSDDLGNNFINSSGHHWSNNNHNNNNHNKTDYLSPRQLLAEQQQVPYFACIKNDINRQVSDTLENWSSQQPIAAHFKLSFFAHDKPVYAIPRIPCGLESTADTALKLVRKESIELQRYMRDVYHVDDKICRETGAIRFPCKDRWLKGEEYGFLIRHYFVYSRVLKFHILSEKYHPNMVYDHPEDGLLYFIRGLHLQDFGFPRVKIPTNAEDGKQNKGNQTVKHSGANGDVDPIPSDRAVATTQMSKIYKWKKINYKTFLPKHAAVVVYIVAKANTFDRMSPPHSHQTMASSSTQGNQVRRQGQANPSNGHGPQTHFMMHAAAHGSEFDKSYTQSDVSRQLRSEGTRLLPEDRNPGPEVQRVIVCHVKQKTVDAAKRNKRNKPCRQFRKQVATNTASSTQQNTGKVFDIAKTRDSNAIAAATSGNQEQKTPPISTSLEDQKLPDMQMLLSDEGADSAAEDDFDHEKHQAADNDDDDGKYFLEQEGEPSGEILLEESENGGAEGFSGEKDHGEVTGIANANPLANIRPVSSNPRTTPSKVNFVLEENGAEERKSSQRTAQAPSQVDDGRENRMNDRNLEKKADLMDESKVFRQQLQQSQNLNGGGPLFPNTGSVANRAENKNNSQTASFNQEGVVPSGAALEDHQSGYHPSQILMQHNQQPIGFLNNAITQPSSSSPVPPPRLSMPTAPQSTLVGEQTLGVRPVAPTADPQQLLAEISSFSGGAAGTGLGLNNNGDYHSELSGFDSDMMTPEEQNEILESRNKSLIEHMFVLTSDKLTKWRKEMNRQQWNKNQQHQTLASTQQQIQQQQSGNNGLMTPSQLTAGGLLESQSTVCKYAYFMAKWKHNIYKKFVRDLQVKEHQLRFERQDQQQSSPSTQGLAQQPQAPQPSSVHAALMFQPTNLQPYFLPPPPLGTNLGPTRPGTQSMLPTILNPQHHALFQQSNSQVNRTNRPFQPFIMPGGLGSLAGTGGANAPVQSLMAGNSGLNNGYNFAGNFRLQTPLDDVGQMNRRQRKTFDKEMMEQRMLANPQLTQQQQLQLTELKGQDQDDPSGIEVLKQENYMEGMGDEGYMHQQEGFVEDEEEDNQSPQPLFVRDIQQLTPIESAAIQHQKPLSSTQYHQPSAAQVKGKKSSNTKTTSAQQKTTPARYFKVIRKEPPAVVVQQLPDVQPADGGPSNGDDNRSSTSQQEALEITEEEEEEQIEDKQQDQHVEIQASEAEGDEEVKENGEIDGPEQAPSETVEDPEEADDE